VLNCIAAYEPINKARLITLLSAGSGSTKRIASFIAYYVIIDRPASVVVRFFIGSIHNTNVFLGDIFRPASSR
jgi:hypothetical protein